MFWTIAIAVSDAADDHRDRADPDVRRDRGPRRAEREQQQRARVEHPDAEPRARARAPTGRRRRGRRRSRPRAARSRRSPRCTRCFARKISATLTKPNQICAIVQATSTVISDARPADRAEPVAEVAPVAAADRALALQQPRRDPADERRRDGEGAGVQPVGEVRARGGDERTAEQRADRGRRPLGELQERVGVRQLVVVDEVRAARRGRPAGRTRCRSPRRRRARRSRPALETNGSAAKTASRPRSEAIIRPLRESRSTSGPNSSPIAIAGRTFAISTALIHQPEWFVRT